MTLAARHRYPSDQLQIQLVPYLTPRRPRLPEAEMAPVNHSSFGSIEAFFSESMRRTDIIGIKIPFALQEVNYCWLYCIEVNLQPRLELYRCLSTRA